MENLVALDAIKTWEFPTRVVEEDSTDFIATTTINLGVTSPSLSRGISFKGSPI